MIKKALAPIAAALSFLLPATARPEPKNPVPVVQPEKAEEPVAITGGESQYKRKVPLDQLVVAGLSRTMDNPAAWTVPIGALIVYRELDRSCWDVLLRADTLGASAQLHCREFIGYGARSWINYVAHSVHKSYDATGHRQEGKEMSGHEVGVDMFLTLRDILTFTLGAGGKMYAARDTTVANVPGSHPLARASLDVSLLHALEHDKILWIKDGVELTAQASGEFRPGFGAGNPDVQDKHYGGNLLLHLGAHYLTAGGLNIQTEGRLGTQSADIHNAWKLGSMASRQGPVPGANLMEIHAGQFVQGQLWVSVPVGEHYRPGIGGNVFSALSGVEGAADWSGQMLRSVTAGVHARAGGVLPLAVKYGYSPDVYRNGTKGGHEVFALVMAGF